MKYKRLAARLSVLLAVLSLFFAGSVLPAKAQGRTITLQSGPSGYELVDSQNSVGTNVNESNKGSYSSLVNSGTVQWEFGSGSTLVLDFVLHNLPITTPSYESANELDISTTGSYTLISSLAGWTADNTNHLFKHWGTACGGNVTHTTSQSDVWHNFLDGTHAEAEWSGLMKYSPPGGGCDVHIFYSLGAGSPYFRPSATDAHYAQWPSSYLNCPFQDYSTDHRVKCTYTGVVAQISHRVKLFSTPTSFTTATFVTVAVFEKDSAGDYIPLANPSNVTGWTFN